MNDCFEYEVRSRQCQKYFALNLYQILVVKASQPKDDRLGDYVDFEEIDEP